MRKAIVDILKAPYRAWWRREIRPRIADVPLDRLLLGGECSIAGSRYARLVGDPLRTSRTIGEWPHTRLLMDFQNDGEAVLAPDILTRSDYWNNAAQCLAHTGRYFSAQTDAGIRDVAISFLRRTFPRLISAEGNSSSPEHSSPSALPIVAPIFASPYFQVMDGHHRAACAHLRGEKTIRALVSHWPVKTRLQEMVLDVVWQHDRTELYQPVSAPEFSTWTQVRRCADRFQLMTAKLAELNIAPAGHSYLDVGSSYGWFVAQMERLGYDASGVELDRFAACLAKPLYGASPDCIIQSDAARYLQANEARRDVVSCFSVLHHFALGKGAVDAATFTGLLARATGRVLFIDTGECHECWFRETLRDWTPDYIEQWLLRHTGFRQVVRLGRDQDNVPPFADAYGRTLFACIR